MDRAEEVSCGRYFVPIWLLAMVLPALLETNTLFRLLVFGVGQIHC